jgi:hypothetical protein
MRQFKVVVEKHADGYVAYPLGLKGVVVGEGDSYEDALADVKSAIASISRPLVPKPLRKSLPSWKRSSQKRGCRSERDQVSR